MSHIALAISVGAAVLCLCVPLIVAGLERIDGFIAGYVFYAGSCLAAACVALVAGLGTWLMFQ